MEGRGRVLGSPLSNINGTTATATTTTTTTATATATATAATTTVVCMYVCMYVCLCNYGRQCNYGGGELCNYVCTSLKNAPCAGPYLGLGKRGSCPGDPTTRGLHICLVIFYFILFFRVGWASTAPLLKAAQGSPHV